MPPRQPSCLISGRGCRSRASAATPSTPSRSPIAPAKDRKSTRLNSSHLVISYAVFCLKKKKALPRHVDEDTIDQSRVDPLAEQLAQPREARTAVGVGPAEVRVQDCTHRPEAESRGREQIPRQPTDERPESGPPLGHARRTPRRSLEPMPQAETHDQFFI